MSTTRHRRRTRRAALAVLLGAAALAVVAPAAAADPGAGIGGYTANAQALGVQIAFNIPDLIPLPDENLVEEDVPFARTTVSSGPVVNALGAPYYPGDILGNFGSLLAEFAPPGSPSFPNDPLLALANYPPAPGHGEDASFGGTPPPGVPLSPDVFSATAHADQSTARVTATLVDVRASSPSGPTAALAQLGPPPASGGLPVLGGLGAASAASPAVSVGTVQSTNAVTIASDAVTATAGSVLKAVDIGGVLDISQLVSSASTTSDGNQGTPSATLHLVDVTADGQPAYIDKQGVHVSGTSTSATGVTPAQAQAAVNNTFAQDGISVRLVDPSTTTDGAQGSGDAGGLVVTVTHQFDVPFIPGEPSVPVPELGNTNLPAGTYSAVTSITLGAAVAGAQATLADTLGDLGGVLGPPSGTSPVSLGIPSLPGTASSATPGGATAGAGVAGGDQFLTGAGAGPPGSGPLLAGAAHRLPLGLPVPVAWVLAAIVLCTLVTYPMLLAARWQFLSGRRR